MVLTPQNEPQFGTVEYALHNLVQLKKLAVADFIQVRDANGNLAFGSLAELMQDRESIDISKMDFLKSHLEKDAQKVNADQVLRSQYFVWLKDGDRQYAIAFDYDGQNYADVKLYKVSWDDVDEIAKDVVGKTVEDLLS